jgi:hypothetical protein
MPRGVPNTFVGFVKDVIIVLKKVVALLERLLKSLG